MISKKQLNMYLFDLEEMAKQYVETEDGPTHTFMWIRLNGALCAGAELGVFNSYPKGFVSCMDENIYDLCAGNWPFKDLLDSVSKHWVNAEDADKDVNDWLKERIHKDLIDNMSEEARHVLEEN